MAEAVGIALAIPGVIDSTVRGASVVHEKINTFRCADETMAQFRDLTSNIKEGTLYFALANIKAVSSDRLIPPEVLAQLDKALRDVNKALDDAEQGLSLVREHEVFGKLRYTFWHGDGGKHRLDKLFGALKCSCDNLKDICLQFFLHRNAESCYFLTSDFFKLRHETSNGLPGTTLPDSDILIAQGNYGSHGQRIVSDFVCETKTHENDFKFLSTKLSKDSLKGQEGVLPVLGYRQPLQNSPDGTKMFQLVFELPTGSDRSSLSHLLQKRPGPDLVERLALCRKLAVATKTIHSIGLVHKALRSRSILILSTPGAPLSTAKLYLQDWTCARELSGATAELGEGVWPKRIYQHPERQGKYAEAAYEPRHDIYSLGVCMLEILLWTPFVLTDAASPVKELKVCDLFQQYGFARKETDGGLPNDSAETRRR